MEKYCIDVMKKDISGRFRLERRGYVPDDVEGKEAVRFIRKSGLKAYVKKEWKEISEELDVGEEYLFTFFREKRKRTGAIKSKKKLDSYRVEVVRG
jgi:hypothetical protein